VTEVDEAVTECTRRAGPPPNCDEIIVSSGYEYYHYNCDGADDRVRQLYIVVSVEYLLSRDTTCPYYL